MLEIVLLLLGIIHWNYMGHLTQVVRSWPNILHKLFLSESLVNEVMLFLFQILLPLEDTVILSFLNSRPKFIDPSWAFRGIVVIISSACERVFESSAFFLRILGLRVTLVVLGNENLLRNILILIMIIIIFIF